MIPDIESRSFRLGLHISVNTLLKVCNLFPTVNNRYTFYDCEGETIERVFVDCFHATWCDLQNNFSKNFDNISYRKTDILLIFKNNSFSSDLHN